MYTDEQTVVLNPYQWYEWDVLEAVSMWHSGYASNYGMILIASNEDSPGYDVRFRSSEASSNKPYLEVKYKIEYTANYYLKDHLGNIRVTVDENGDVVSHDDYYPFGLRMAGRSYNAGTDNDIYKYNGKELDDEAGINWHYYGARYYDAEIGRWDAVDPLANKYPAWSPYNYTLNNPHRFIDPDGREVTVTINRSEDNGSTTMGAVSVTSDIVNDTFDGYTLEPSSSDGSRAKASAGTYTAWQRTTSQDGKEYNPNRVQLDDVTNEDGGQMVGYQLHVGNELVDSQGCALVGETKSDNFVGSSKDAMKSINSIIDADGSGDITVIINEPPQPEPQLNLTHPLQVKALPLP